MSRYKVRARPLQSHPLGNGKAAARLTSFVNRAAYMHRCPCMHHACVYVMIALHIGVPASPYVSPIRREMGFQVTPALEEDISRLVDIQFSAFGDDPTHQILYPGDRFSKAVRANASERTLTSWRQTPEMHIIKSVDRGTGCIAGFAKWTFYDTQRSEDEWNVRPTASWAVGGHRTVVEQLLATTAEIRGRRWGGKPYARE